MTALRGSIALDSHKSDDNIDNKSHQRTFLPNNSPSYSSREKRRHNSSCAECQRDQQQCQRGTLPGKCIRCAQYKYPCTTLPVDEIEKPKRRKVESQTCSYCRQEEQRCLPLDRTWPETKCERCIKQSLPCSEPLFKINEDERSKGTKAVSGKHPSSEESASDDGSFTPPIDSPQELSGRLGVLESVHPFSDAPQQQQLLQVDEKSQSSFTDDQEVNDPTVLGSPGHIVQSNEGDQENTTTTSYTLPFPRNSGRSMLICPVCRKSVKTQSELKKHDLRHRKPFFCHVSGCPRTEGFSTSNDLERHTTSKHPSSALATTPGVKKFRCLVPGCKSSEKAWPRLDNFRSHLKRVHGSNLRTDDDYDDLVRRGEFLDVGKALVPTAQKERQDIQSSQASLDNIKSHDGALPIPKVSEQEVVAAQIRKDVDPIQAHVPRRPRPTGVVPHKASISLPQMVERWGSLIFRSEYEYKALHTDETRILVLLPGKKDDIIQCRLLPLSIKAPKVSYEALSYCWGDDVRATKEIRIQCMKRSDRPSLKNFVRAKRFISANLHSALVHLRDSSYPITLWVDKLCINMNDKQERSRQVSKIDQIYQQANNVCVWLGESDESSRSALTFIPRILNLSSLDRELEDENNEVHWKALENLISRPWFSRRWVIQEISYAKSSTVHCGDDVVHWADFADAVGLFASRFTKVRCFEDPDHRKGLYASETSYRPAQVLVESSESLIQDTSNGNCLQIFDLETLLWKFRHFTCKDPRDAVYSLLALVKKIRLNPSENETRTQLYADYGADVMDVLRYCVMHCVVLSNSLDIFCRPWAPTIKKPLPSWIRTVADSAFDLDSTSFSVRRYGDSFIGPPNRKIYNASAGRPLADFPFSQAGPLVHGRKVDIIGACLPRTMDGIVWREALHMGGWNEQSNKFDSVPEKVWRTLVANRSPDGSPPKIWYQRACLYTLAQIPSTANLNTSALISLGGPSIMIEFLERVQSVVWNRKFFTTANGRFFGLGPDGLQSGDVVTVLYGCSVPVVLRAVGQQYQLVGECYIHGLMDGQAITDPDLRDETFHLC